MYKDAQHGCRQMYLLDDANSLNSAKANAFYEAWIRKRPGKDVWLVLVNSTGNEGDELTFVYPFDVEPGVTPKAILREAQMQHERFGRPPKVGRAEVIHVTQAFINSIPRKIERGMGICDFCSSNELIVAKFKARDFVMQTGRLSLGAWAACPSCSQLVESRDMDGLTKRMVEISGNSSDRSLEVARRQVQDFFQHKI